MKYLIIGAGATGSSIGAFMSKANKDVTLLARGKRYDFIKNNGISFDTVSLGSFNAKVNVANEDNYNQQPDVIFVCVKGYSIESVIPIINKFAHSKTIIVPILNILTTGEFLQSKFPNLLVTDGCVYITSNVQSNGTVKLHGDIFRIVFGVRDSKQYTDRLVEIKNDLSDSNIESVLSNNIKKDAFLKFSYVSAQAACGLYYNATAEKMQQAGEIRECFISLVKEIELTAKSMGINLGNDIVERNLNILDSLLPTSSTSMQRDIYAGKKSEIDGLIYTVNRLAKKNNIVLPTYSMVENFARNKLKL